MSGMVGGMQSLGRPAAPQAGSGTKQTEKTDDGFQKLLEEKTQDDASSVSKEETGAEEKPVEDPEEEHAAKEPSKDKPEIPEEKLKQLQAALFVQMSQLEPVQEPAAPEGEPLAEAGKEALFAVTGVAEEAAPAEQVAEAQPQRTAEEAVQPAEPSVQEAGPSDAGTDREPVLSAEPGESAVKETVTEQKAEPGAEQKTEQLPEQAGLLEQQAQPVQSTADKGPEFVQEAKLPAEIVRVQTPEELPEKLTNQLLTKVLSDQREFEVQLEPVELGKIVIKVAFSEKRAAVSIVCSEQSTMELLAKNARSIGGILEEHLGAPTAIYVEEKAADYLDQHPDSGNGYGYEQEKEQRQKQDEKQEKDESMSFLHQLRLGLV